MSTVSLHVAAWELRCKSGLESCLPKRRRASRSAKDVLLSPSFYVCGLVGGPKDVQSRQAPDRSASAALCLLPMQSRPASLSGAQTSADVWGVGADPPPPLPHCQRHNCSCSSQPLNLLHVYSLYLNTSCRPCSGAETGCVRPACSVTPGHTHDSMRKEGCPLYIPEYVPIDSCAHGAGFHC